MKKQLTLASVLVMTGTRFEGASFPVSAAHTGAALGAEGRATAVTDGRPGGSSMGRSGA